MSLTCALWIGIPGLILVVGLACWWVSQNSTDLDDDKWWL